MTWSPEQTEEKGDEWRSCVGSGFGKNTAVEPSCCVMAGKAVAVTDWEGVTAAPLQFLSLSLREEKYNPSIWPSWKMIQFEHSLEKYSSNVARRQRDSFSFFFFLRLTKGQHAKILLGCLPVILYVHQTKQGWQRTTQLSFECTCFQCKSRDVICAPQQDVVSCHSRRICVQNKFIYSTSPHLAKQSDDVSHYRTKWLVKMDFFFFCSVGSFSL